MSRKQKPTSPSLPKIQQPSGRDPVPNTIRKYRKESGLDQKELAFLMGLKSTAMLSRYESGIITPDLENSFALQFALGIPTHLLYREVATRIAGEVRVRRAQLDETASA